MNILFAASEAVPFIKTGGLADVAGSLPAVLAAAGHDVRVVIPLYEQIGEDWRSQMTFLCDTRVQLAWRSQYCGLFELKRDGVTYYFIDNEYYFKRQSLYGSFDDGERYAYFCKAVMEMLPKIDFIPDVLHCHDWQSALCVIYLKRKYCYLEDYSAMKAVYTIHNIDYQGIYNFDILGDIFCLDSWDRYVVEYDGCINLTKGAIVCCDILTTVSPRYAQEIQTEYYSSGLHHILRMNKDKIRGIINGIDTDYYNPATDKSIVKNFDLDTIDGKVENKLALQKTFGLPERADVPMIAMVSRLASHKGFDLVRRVADEILMSDVQFVLLGTGEGELEDFFSNLAQRHPDKCGVMLAFDKILAKQIYASADMFLMPSKSEPCGLAQMIASRYGTIPIVRETGGLYDTIKPYITSEGTGNGFTFKTYNAHDMLDAVRRALSLYCEKEEWSKLVANAMNMDFSWNASAKKYLEMYETVISC